MTLPGLEKTGAVLALLVGSQLWARWRVARRARAEAALPLFDAVALEAALAPRPGEDGAFLADLRDRIAAVNRRACAAEFHALPAQIAGQPAEGGKTLRPALARLAQSGDEQLAWLAAETRSLCPNDTGEKSMSDSATNKQTLRDFIQAVWIERDLAALPGFWTEDCVNHAMPGPDNRGLDALRAYHAAFFAEFAAFSDIQIEILDQIAEGQRVVTHMNTRAMHSGKPVSLSSIRIDRFQDGKIAEHWSVADMMGLMGQLQG